MTGQSTLACPPRWQCLFVEGVVPTIPRCSKSWPVKSVSQNRVFGDTEAWDKFSGSAEQLCDYFVSSGSGQVTVEFLEAT